MKISVAEKRIGDKIRAYTAVGTGWAGCVAMALYGEDTGRTAAGLKRSVVEGLGLPRDVCLGALRVTLTGREEAWVENYRGILEYTGQSILLQGKTCQVRFEGSALVIDYYTNEDMKIRGCITAVRYL